MCLAESCIANGVGAEVQLIRSGSTDATALLVGEEPSRVVVSFAPEFRDRVRTLCKEQDVAYVEIGEVGGDTLNVAGVARVAVSELARAHRSALDTITDETPAR